MPSAPAGGPLVPGRGGWLALAPGSPVSGREAAGLHSRTSTWAQGPRGQLGTCTAPTELPRDSPGFFREGKPQERFCSYLEPFYFFGLYTRLEKTPLEGAQPHQEGIRGLVGG